MGVREEEPIKNKKKELCRIINIEHKNFDRSAF